jgi:hypothetical protein
MRRYSGKIERARELAKKRMASTEKLKKRSFMQARDIVRRRVAGRRGAEYATLSPSEKIQIDTQVEKRKGAIKKIASRLMPKVKAAEYARLKSFTQGAPMQHLHSGPSAQHEQFNNMFEEFAKTVEIVTVDDILNEMTNLVLEKIITEKQIQALEKRAQKSGIQYDLLEQVYVRGLLDSMGDQHAAFNRVNAFCCGGKTAMNEDFDLYEQIERKDLNEEFASYSFKENFMDGKGPGKPGDAARHGLKGKTAAELKSIRSSDSASPRKKQLAHFMLNMTKNESADINDMFEAGLWDNIHAKRKRIKAGSGERMRKPGSEGAPTKQNFRDASESIEEGYDVSSKHYKALTDLDLNTKNRDMTTQNDGYGPLNPNDQKGSKSFWDAKAKMWNTTTEAAMEARCGNCAAFNQAPAIMKKMAEGLGPAGEKIQDLANLGFCELFEFKCAGDRTCNKWLVNGPITEKSAGTEARKKIEKVDRKPPHTELGKQAEIMTKIIDEEGNCEPDPKKRLQGTKSLVKAYKKDTPGESLDESFNIAFAAGVGVTLTAADMGMKAQGGFALHPSVVQEMEKQHNNCGTPECCGECTTVDETAKTADKAPVVIPGHKDAYGNDIPAKTVLRRKSKAIVNTGDNPTDGQ